ncbi:hypothetical protein BN1110_00309 [bacterium YEK0313]|nr:hypothetical protein BN1110_00309 [bacterium YEK0313]
MDADLIERIYEAAFVPDEWPKVLGTIAARANATTGELQVLTDGRPPFWQATELTRDMLGSFIASGQWQSCERPFQFLRTGHPGFLRDTDVLTPEQIERDPVGRIFADLGLGWQVATVIPMPTGEGVGLTFERRLEAGRAADDDVATLDGMRPHLARATLIAARLRLERAQATVSTLEKLALPAAVISGRGRVVASNEQFETAGDLFLPVAFGSMAVADAAANRLFQDAVLAAGSSREPLVRSIPVRRGADHTAAVIHMLPLRRAAHDIFSQADILVLMTEVRPDGNVPPLQLLSVLFDLAPAEARLASAIAAGKSLKSTAAEMRIEYNSARTYLARIFSKTGTSQQSELVALLKSAVAISKDQIFPPRPSSL